MQAGTFYGTVPSRVLINRKELYMATEKTNIAINVGNRIKAERVRRKISQEALAEKIGIDRKTINRIENGHFSPSLENFMLICDFLYLEPSVVLYKASSI